MTLAWTAVAAAGSAPPRVLFAQARIRRRGARAFGAAKPIDPTAPADSPQWKPALATAGAVVHAVFVDARARSADANLPQAGVYYTRIRAGRPEAAKRLDTGKPDPLAAKLDNSWSPAIAVSGNRVLVSWLDFQHYDWDVMSRLSSDGGNAFASQVDSNLDPPDVEDLSDSPKPIFTKSGPLIAWTDFHKRDSVDRVHPLYDTYLAAPGKPAVQVDPYGGKQVSTFWPSACGDGNDAIVAFQDSATGVGRIRITRVHGGKKRGHAFPLSDSPAAAYRPAIACANGRFIAAWEDTRNGPSHIFATTGNLKRIAYAGA